MTRKERRAMAQALLDTIRDAKNWQRPNWRPGVFAVASRIATEILRTDPRFDRSYFMAVIYGEAPLKGI